MSTHDATDDTRLIIAEWLDLTDDGDLDAFGHVLDSTLVEHAVGALGACITDEQMDHLAEATSAWYNEEIPNDTIALYLALLIRGLES